MQYQVIESKLNHMSLEELEIMIPDPYKVVVNKLLNISSSTDSNDKRIIQKMAIDIAFSDVNKMYIQNGKLKGISYIHNRRVWECRVTLNGKRVTLKTNRDRKVVEHVYNEFCKLKHANKNK